MVRSSPVAGAEISTFLAPAETCARAASALVKKPVDSMTTSTPRSPHGRAPGSRLDSTLNSLPSTLIAPSPARYVVRQLAHHRVVLEQVGKGLGVRQVVDGDDLDVLVERIDRSPEVAADPAESIHSDAHSHVCQPSSRGFPPRCPSDTGGIDQVTPPNSLRGDDGPHCIGSPDPACRVSVALRLRGDSGRRSCRVRVRRRRAGSLALATRPCNGFSWLLKRFSASRSPNRRSASRTSARGPRLADARIACVSRRACRR